MPDVNYVDVTSPPYGADRTGTNDSTAAINLALANANGNEVFFPSGIYLISGSIFLKSGSRIRGEGKKQSTLKATSSSAGIVVNGNLSHGVYYWEIVDIGLDGNGIGSVGLQINYAREGFMKNCYISNFQKGVTTNQAWSNGIHASEIVQNSDTNVELGSNSNDFTFVDCQLDGGGKYGVSLMITDGRNNSKMISFFGCVFQSCGLMGIHVASGRAIHISGCYFEGNNPKQLTGAADISVDAAQGVNIIGSHFWGTPNTPMINLNAASGVFIGGCTFEYSSPNVSIQTSNNTSPVVVAGCNINTPFNDAGGKINDLSNLNFKGSMSVRSPYGTLTLNTPDNTKPPSFSLQEVDKEYARLSLGSNGDLYMYHYNQNKSVMEPILQVNYKNDLIWSNNSIFQNGLQVSNGLTLQGKGHLKLDASAWNGPHIQLGNYHLWIDATGALRLKSSAPTNDTDGTIVSNQLNVTSGATSLRPSGVQVGYQFFDTTLNKPIWLSKSGWVDAGGAKV